MQQLIGRQREIAELDRCMKSGQSEFITVCGRRRIGKTFLIEQYFHQKYAFSYVGGHHLTQEEQLLHFTWALQKYSGSPFTPRLSSWQEAFHALEQLLEQSTESRKVVFIDEMPWIDNKNSKFVSALEYFWNGWAVRRSDIVLIATGSATSWMTDKLENNQGGLHNRITSRLFLLPFTLKEAEHYLQSRGFSWDRYTIVQTYMIMGGVPYYLSMLRPEFGLPSNIDELFFGANPRLRREFDELFYALFNNAEKYIDVIKALYKKKGGMTRDDIVNATKIQGGMLSKMLRNLELCNFISIYSYFGRTVRNSVYRLTDNFTLFYLKFIESDRSKDKAFWTHLIGKPELNTWQGLTFESICLTHVDAIKKALRIDGISTQCSTWRNENGQIDLLIKRADRLINACEMKFCTEPYEITSKYADQIRNRIAEFRSSTHTRYGIINTFITTYGVKPGKNSSIAQMEITLDSLFQ
ncbi:MAG: AAA family ATPase [Bacteroidaceae bacterium]|nr:AAA family ATPase [Bacteroidaceae bacterium]